MLCLFVNVECGKVALVTRDLLSPNKKDLVVEIYGHSDLDLDEKMLIHIWISPYHWKDASDEKRTLARCQ